MSLFISEKAHQRQRRRSVCSPAEAVINGVAPMQDNTQSKNQERAKDDPGQAFEEGEPKLTGRSHGEIIDDDGTGAGKEAMEDQGKSHRGHNDNTSGSSGKTSQAPESGRQRATP
jgi:hypothetical protein